MSSLLKNKEDEEYEKKLEEARKLRQSMGIVTSRDIENGYDANENTISLNNDSDYQKRLEEARNLRYSMGIKTPRELEEENQIDNINFDTQYSSFKPTIVEQEKNNKKENNNIYVTSEDNNRLSYKDFIAKGLQKKHNNINIANAIIQGQENVKETVQNNQSIINRKNKIIEENTQNNTDKNQKKTYQITEVPEKISGKNTNIFQDIGGFFKALFSGAKNGVSQSAHYIEVMNESNNNYNSKRTQQFLTSSKVSEQQKAQYKASLTNNNIDTPETNLVKKYMEDKIIEENKNIVNNANKMTNNFSKKLAGDILPSVGQMGVGAALNVVSPGLGLNYFFTSAGGSYYDDAIQRGMTKEQATKYSTVMAGFEAVTEELTYENFTNAGRGIEKILGIGQNISRDITKKETTNLIKDILKDYGLGIAENFVQEAVIEPLQEMSSQIISGNSNWDKIGERMLEAGIDGGIVAALVGGADIGINSCINVVDKLQSGEKITNKEYKNAIQDLYNNPNIDVEKTVADSILYQINNSTMDSYYTVQTNQDGNVEKVQEYLGKPIENLNRNLKITPIIIRNSEQNSFNIIDKDSGLVLDSTPYQTLEKAENGFYKKTLKLDDATIKNINNKLAENRIAVKKFMTEIAEDITNNYQNAQNDNISNFNNETTNISSESINNQNRIEENSKESSFSMRENNNYQLKEKQLEIINNSNPMTDDIHTGIRSVEDIKTFQETLQDKEWSDYKEFNPDYTMEMANEAINKGKITVYSSYPIEQGTFVTPSKMEAESYAGDGKIYSQEVNLKDIAWIDPTQGQVAIINENNLRNTGKVEKSSNIEYNNKGIRLNKTEYANVMSLINTNKPNSRGTQTINSSDYFYIYESDSFDNNKIIMKIKINDNEDLINTIRRGIEDGTIDSTEKAIRSLEEYARHGRRLDNSDNDISQRTTKNRKINRLYIRDVENGKETRQGQNNKQSNRNKPGIENSNQSSFSMQENNDNVRAMTQKQETDNQGRKLSKEQQEFFKDSKVRDENGHLKVVYHGTNNDFNEFDISYLGSASGDVGFLGDGFYVATHKGEASYYGDNVMKGYVNIKNPFNIKELSKYNGKKFIGEDTAIGLEIKNLIDLNEQWKDIKINSTTFGEIANATDDFLKNVKIKKLGAVEDYSGNETGTMWEISYNNKKNQQESITNYSEENIKADALNKYIKKQFGYIRGADIIQYITEANRFDKNIKSFNQVLQQNGYDGIIQDTPQTTDEIVFFNSNQFKNIDNISPTSNEDIRYMRKSNTTKKEIKVDPSIQKELHNRIQNSLLSSNSRKNTFLGKVTEKVVNKVKQLYGIDISGRNHVLSDNDIRHIIRQHGNDKIEKSRGQIAITTKDIEKIPDIINNYDKIEKGNVNKDNFTNQNYNTIRYIKKYSDNATYVVEVIPTNTNQLTIKTMWKKKIDISKKNNSSRVNHANSNIDPQNTPKAEPTSSYSYDSISQNMENVKENKIPEVKTNAERGESYIEQEIQKIEKTGQWDNSIPVTKLRDINNVIEDYLGLGIKKGRFRERAFGIYKGKRDVIRVKEFKDIDTILHETGHALDIGKRIKIDKESISGELIDAIDRRGGYEDAQREIKLEEGFAEVIREYSIVPERAKVDAPQTVAILEEMRKQDKNFNNFINKVQTLSYNYIHQNPQNRVQSNISIGERTDKKKWDKDSIRQAVVKTIWDKDYAIKDVVNNDLKKDGTKLKASENAYLLTRLASGIGNKTTSMLADGYIDENGNRLFPGLNKLGEILDNDQQRFNDLRAYLISKRDLDYKSKSMKTGVRTTDSLNTINKFKNDKQIQEAAEIVYDTLDGVLQYAVNNNFITEETAETFRKSNAFYVPMQRVLENDRGNNVGRRGAVQEAFKKRKGSELDIKDPLENIVANSANIIQQVENNNVLKALYKQGESVGLTGAVYDKIATPMTKTSTQQLSIWEQELSKQGVDTSNLDLEKAIDMFAPNNRINTNDNIANFIDDDGNRIYLQFNDKEVFNALMGIDSKNMSILLNISSKLNMPLRVGATMGNIAFAIPNMISDTVQATIYSEAGFVPIVDNAIGVLDVLAATNENVNKFMQKVAPEYVQRINNIYKLYQQSGASSSTRLSQYRKSSQELMPNVYGTKNSEVLGIDEKFKPLKRLLDIMTYIPELSEQSTRLRVFERNYDLYKKQGNTEIDSRIMAAIESRDATQDFGRMGTVTSEINKALPFSAARMGSLYTFAEKIKANPKKVSFKIAMLATLAMAIKGLGYDDKEIEELNQRKKDDNFVIKVGDTVMTFKKPQGILRSIVNLTEYIQDLTTGHIESGKEGERLGEWISNAIMDNMPADEISGLAPNPITPIIENSINKDFYYNTEIVKSYDEDLPDYMQYYDYNSQLAIWLGRIFNYSPAKIDNLISGYFGGLGTQVTNAIDWVSGKLGLSAEKPNMGAEENAIGKRFVVNVNSNSQSINDIYNLRTELTKKQNGGNITEEETKQLEKINSAVSKISDLNKQIKSIKQDLTMSGDEKADAIRPLQEQKTDVARQALGKELIHPENEENIASLQFYPSQDILKLNNYSLELTDEMKKEYENIAYTQYKKYESQGLYSKDYLKTIESKCKEYAKKVLMQKYKNMLVKSK